MKVNIHATDREMEQKRERMLDKLADGKYVVRPRVADEPSTVKSLRQMEELMEKDGQHMVDYILAEMKASAAAE